MPSTRTKQGAPKLDSVTVEEDVEPAKPLATIPFTELPLGTVDQFQQLHPLHDHCIVTIYQIVRDLHIKQDVADIEIVDGTPWGQDGYFIEARSRNTGKCV